MPMPDRRSALGPALLALSLLAGVYSALGAPGLTALAPAGRDPGAIRMGMLALSAVIALLSLAPSRSWWAARQRRAPLSASWARRLAALSAAVFIGGTLTCLFAGLILPHLLAGPGGATLTATGFSVVAWSGLAAALAAPLGWGRCMPGRGAMLPDRPNRRPSVPGRCRSPCCSCWPPPSHWYSGADWSPPPPAPPR